MTDTFLVSFFGYFFGIFLAKPETFHLTLFFWSAPAHPSVGDVQFFIPLHFFLNICIFPLYIYVQAFSLHVGISFDTHTTWTYQVHDLSIYNDKILAN